MLKLLTMYSDSFHKNNNRWFLLLAAAFLIIIYFNSLQAPFLFDDKQNIVDRSELHLTHLSPDAVIDTFIRNGKVLRPISYFSFALNYYVGEHNVAGYHLINIAIHIITTCFLYKITLILLSAGKFRFTKEDTFCIAGFATILWAAHPIHVSAVTYIVQRMALLSTMFYVIGLWAYLCGRQKIQSGAAKGSIWLSIALVAFFCGVFSKENAVLLPIGILLVELFFLQGAEIVNKRPVIVIGCIVLIMSFIVLIGIFVFQVNLENIYRAYDHRPFTLKQRCLTEPRVLVFYLSQLFYPSPGRFSMFHFLPLSDSLVSPLSTGLALSGIVASLIFAFVWGRKNPFLGFPIMFYFIHHLMESSIISLEIVYEHRNYLPSLFLFLPVAAACFKILRFYENKNRWMRGGLIILFIAVLVFLGIATHQRNYEWRSEKSFWMHELAAAPGLARPYLGLGWYYTQPGSLDLDRAAELFRQGATQSPYHNKFEIADLWLNLARTYEQRQNFREAKQLALKSRNCYQAVIDETPELREDKPTEKSFAAVYAVLAEISSHENMEEALAFINQAIDLHGSNNYYKMKANYLMHAGRYEEAIETMRLLLRASPEDWRVFLGLGQAMTLTGHLSRGIWYYKQYLNKAMNSHALFSPVYLYLSENRYLAGEVGWGDRYLHQFLDMTPHHSMISFLKKMQHGYPDITPFVDKEKMLVKIGDNLCAY